MAVLVAGGAGFLGSHLVDRLIADGHHVVIADDLSTGRIANVDRAVSSGRATFVYLDIAASNDVVDGLLREVIDEPLTDIFHLASPARPIGNETPSWDALRANSIGTLSLIDVALAHGARMTFTSTLDAEGVVNPVESRVSYDEAKRFGETAMSVAMRERGLNGRVVRIFNCYGPRMDIADGRLIPALLDAARNKRPLPVHGDGRQTHAVTYVSDLVAGLVSVARATDVPLPIHLGSEEECTIEDIAREVASVAGVPLDIEWLPGRPVPSLQRLPDRDRAGALGWKPGTSLRSGLEKTYAWLCGDALQYA